MFDLPLRYFSLFIAAIAGANTLNMTIWAVLFCTMLAILIWLAKRHANQPGWGRLAAICAFLAIGMNISYQALGGAVPAIRAQRFDAELLALDRWLLGETPSVLLEHMATPWLTELMSLCYILFMPLLFISLLRYFFSQRELLGEFYAGLFTVYGLGFLGYLLVPAAGPWLAYPELFDIKLYGGTITAVNQSMVEQGSNRVDVWPSLHCAASAFILLFAWRHHRREFHWLLLPFVGLCLSTLYLRYHYFIDMLSGFILAAFALYESRRYARALMLNLSGESKNAATA